MLDPRQDLYRLPQAHVVRQDRAEPQAGHVDQEVETLALVGAEHAAEGVRHRHLGQSREGLDASSQPMDLGRRLGVDPEILERRQTAGLGARELPGREPLLDPVHLDAEIGERLGGGVMLGGALASDPARRELHEARAGRAQAREIGVGERAAFDLPFGAYGEPIHAAGAQPHSRPRDPAHQQLPHATAPEVGDVRRTSLPGLGQSLQGPSIDPDRGARD